MPSEPGKVELVYGNYDLYRTLAQQQAQEKSGKVKEKPVEIRPSQPATGSAKLKRKRKYPYRKAAELEVDIASLEAEIQEMEARLASPDIYREGSKVKELMADLEEARARLPQLYEHWEEAVELNG